MITVEVVYAKPEAQQLSTLELACGTTARKALKIAISRGRLTLDADVAIDSVPLGVFGHLVDDDYPLAENDRLEVYRPLLQDPMQRRRRRASGG